MRCAGAIVAQGTLSALVLHIWIQPIITKLQRVASKRSALPAPNAAKALRNTQAVLDLEDDVEGNLVAHSPRRQHNEILPHVRILHLELSQNGVALPRAFVSNAKHTTHVQTRTHAATATATATHGDGRGCDAALRVAIEHEAIKFVHHEGTEGVRVEPNLRAPTHTVPWWLAIVETSSMPATRRT